jgi:glyoxylase-like metal-dependent hydrolase (beta-lactamase superfamily II)
VHVPGHSDDMSALWWEQEGVLLAGDAAQGTGSRPGSCPLYFGNIAQARASIKRLLDVPFRTLHVAHPFGRLSTDERQTTFDSATGQAFLHESLTALDILEEALRAALRDNGEAEFPDLARAATDVMQQANRWALAPDPLTGVPPNAAPTLYRLWREIASE